MRDPVRMLATDLLDIDEQPSQRVTLGMAGTIDWESAAHLACQRVAWTARRDDGSILACFGINETFPQVQGVAWAVLSAPIGKDHLALTRFMRRAVRDSGLRRIELFARCAAVEGTRAFFREHHCPVDSGTMVAVAMADPTPECRWAVRLGFEPAHVCRRFGLADEPIMLFERIAPVLPVIERRAA